jgi:hypothetical protein
MSMTNSLAGYQYTQVGTQQLCITLDEQFSTFFFFFDFYLKKKRKKATEVYVCMYISYSPIHTKVVHRFFSILGCYDFLNIFAKKFGEKIGVFDSKQS